MKQAGADGHRLRGQALHLATRRAHEVGVDVGRLSGIHGLEAPHAVAEFETPGEAHARQVEQIAVERGAVEALPCECGGHLEVAQGAAGLVQQRQHGQAWRRGAPAGGRMS